MGSRGRHPSLRVNKESQRIRKPPPIRLPIVQHRQPIIIHIYSPKVIQTHPNDFMSLVQRLTGRADIETGLKSTDAKDDLTRDDPTVLPSSPVSSTSPHDLQAVDVNLDPASVGVLTSPKSFLHRVKAGVKADKEVLNNPGHNDHAFALAPGHLTSPSSSYNTLACPRVWSPVATPNMFSQRFLADLPFLSSGKQGPAENLFLPSPRNIALASPRLWSPTTTPNTWSQKFLMDLPCLSPEKQGRPADNPFLPSPRLLSPRIRHAKILPSLGTLA